MTILTSFSVVFASLFIWLRKPKGGFVTLLLKTLASAMLVLITVKILNLAPDAYVGLPALFLLAMGFSLAGDVFIDLKATVPSKAFGFLYLGFLSFLAAQVFLMAAFISLSDVYYSIFFYALAISIGLHYIFIKFMKYQMQGFVIMSSIYSAALITVAIQTGIYAYLSNWEIIPLGFFVAALLFTISDAILSQTFFANKNAKIYTIGVHIAYYGAQLLYLWSLYYFILSVKS